MDVCKVLFRKAYKNWPQKVQWNFTLLTPPQTPVQHILSTEFKIRKFQFRYKNYCCLQLPETLAHEIMYWTNTFFEL
jgi:hypothetical protein